MKWIPLALLTLCGALAQAQETVVHVPKSWSDAVSVDLNGIRAEGPNARLFAKTLNSDIRRSGWMVPSSAGRGTVNVTGICSDAGAGVTLRCKVVLHATGQVYFSRSYDTAGSGTRRLAHRVADEIVEAVTGNAGIASTRILVVGQQNGHKELYLCDADGGNVKPLTRDRTVSMMPRWAPSSDRFVYTSFRQGFPDIYEVNLASGKRERLSKQSGLNTGATYAPDGRSIAMVLSKDGNPEIYSMALSSRRLTRLTKSPRSGESSPSYSPDGRQIVFVSDASGSPQLYVMSRNGGSPRRITYKGRENVAPHWGSDGRIVYASRRFGRYQICLYDPEKRADAQLTEEHVDHEDPTWAPNGRHVAYTRTDRGRSGVYVLDTASGASIPLLNSGPDWYAPSWSHQ